MSDEIKKQQLRKYKIFATGLFVFMAVVFVLMLILQKNSDAGWIGYVKAFSEAAIVGALADWFAVTALFHHPMGIPIPHTNLIEKSKERIGDNLGSFVVSNFLSPQNIRPYIQNLKVSHFAGEWLSAQHNKELLLRESSAILLDILHKLDDAEVADFLSLKMTELSKNIKLNKFFGTGLEYILHKNEHQKLITQLSGQIKLYILENQNLVRERVKKESFTLIPAFVDEKIAQKITNGLSSYFEEIETGEDHELRREITQKLLSFSQELRTNPSWESDFEKMRDDFLSGGKVNEYAADIWISVKKLLISELSVQNGAFIKYLSKNLDQLSEKLKTDEVFQHKIDQWVRVTAYRYLLKNTGKFGNLISDTVGNWHGRELSNKLELEVGKDLQFIRVNGTLVGGFVGLLIYAVSQMF